MNEHYDCGGLLTESEAGTEYICSRCNAKVRASVVERQEPFERVAEGQSPLSDIAAAALRGNHD